MIARRPTSLKGRALQLLAQRDQSKVELRRKLLAHARALASQRRVANALDPTARATEAVTEDEPDASATMAAEVESALSWLEAQGFLSIERFAESRINARLERFGNLRIRQELSRHEAPLEPEAAAALASSEYDRARAVRERKFSAAAPDSRQSAARQARFLAARGFSADVIRRVLRIAGQADPEGE